MLPVCSVHVFVDVHVSRPLLPVCSSCLLFFVLRSLKCSCVRSFAIESVWYLSQELDSARGPCEHVTIASSIGALELEPGKSQKHMKKMIELTKQMQTEYMLIHNKDIEHLWPAH
jgi:hypothetical protein